MMSIKYSFDLIDYYAPLTAVTSGKDIAVLSSDNFLGMMTLGSDKGLYLFCHKDGEEATAPFTKLHITKDVSSFCAMRIKGENTFVFAFIKKQKVYLCVSDRPTSINENSFKALNLKITGFEDCVPDSVNITGLGDETYLSVAVKEPGGKIRRLTVDCRQNKVSPFPVVSNFTKIKTEVMGRSIQEAVDGIYTLGEYGEVPQLLYTPLFNVFGPTPPAPKRFLLPKEGGDTLCICPLKNETGSHLFMAGNGGIYYYPYSMQYDCEHTDNPDPVIVASRRSELKQITTMSSFIYDNKLYIYVLSSEGKLYYTFANYDSRQDEAGKFSELLLLRENCLSFCATEGTLFICEKDKLLFGTRDIESGIFRFKEAHFDAALHEFASFHGVHTKIVTDSPNMEITIEAGNEAEAYINGKYHKLDKVVVKSDYASVVDIVQYADGLSVEPFKIICGKEYITIDPACVYQDRLKELSTPQGIKNAKIQEPNGSQSPLLPTPPSQDTLDNAAKAVSGLLDSKNFASNRAELSLHEPVYATRYQVESSGEIVLADDSNGILYFLDDVFNSLYHAAESTIHFATNIVTEGVTFIIQIEKEIFTFILDTAWKALSAISKLLSYIGIPFDKLLDFLRFVFDVDAIMKERDALKKQVTEGLEKAKPSIRKAQGEVDAILDGAAASIAEWAGLPTPEDIDKKPEQTVQPTTQNMYLFDIIWRRFDLQEFLNIDIGLKPSKDLQKSIQSFIHLLEAEGIADVVQSSSTQLSAWILQHSENMTAAGLIESLKAGAGAIVLPCIQFTKKIMDAAFDLFLQATDFMIQVLNYKFHIPVISDILNIYGISDFSILDLILLPAAFFIRIFQYADNTVNIEQLVSSQQNNRRLPEKEKADQILAYQIVIFIIELCETGLTFSESKIPDKEKEGLLGEMYNILQLGIVIGDFLLCLTSGNIWAPMDQETDDNWGSKAYTVLWYCKTIVSSVSYIVKIGSKMGKKNKLTMTMNVASALLSISSIVAEISSIVIAAKANCPAGDDAKQFGYDKALFILQSSGYIVDDVRNTADPVLDIIDKYPGQIDVARAVFSGLSASVQLAYGITLSIMTP